METFSVNRNIAAGRRPLTDVFQGLEDCTALLAVYGAALPDVLGTAEVNVLSGEEDLYMFVDDEGLIIIGQEHLQKSEVRTLYLDIIHELVHVKQQREGLELFDEKYEYIDRPTELEAYSVAINEAKRLGMSTGEILDYLYVEWLSNEDVLRLARNCGLRV